MNKRSLTALTLVAVLAGVVTPVIAGTRSVRTDNPGATCDLQHWAQLTIDPNQAVDGNASGTQPVPSFFVPGTPVTPPAVYCSPTESLATIWSSDTSDLANPASAPNGNNTPTIGYLTAASATMYEWINPQDSNMSPDAELIVWRIPASNTLPYGAYEIEFDRWCSSAIDGGASAPPGATPTFTWNSYYYTYTGTCAGFNGYDLLLNEYGGVLGYVDLNNATHFTSAPGWTYAVSPVTTNITLGDGALQQNTTGYFNNAVGYNAMLVNTTGYNNNAQGSYALASNTSGYGNSAMGANSLLNLTTGIRNVAVGNNSGASLAVGSYNVDIGWGVTGANDESGVVRIGSPNYAVAAYIAGIYGLAAGGNYVCATSSGQLSTGATCATPSSRRYKEDIHPVSDSTRLMQLEPVSFRYRKTGASGDRPLEYGLIAEDVAKVFPELVVYDEQGRPDAVNYQALGPLLLKVVQEQRQQIAHQQHKLAKVDELEQRSKQQQQQIKVLMRANESLQASVNKLLGRDQGLAKR